MKNEESLYTQFLDFEKENNLFDLKDTRGTYYWDIIRYDVFEALMPKNKVFIPKKHNKKILNIFRQIMGFIKLYFGHTSRKYLFYLCSRDRDIFRNHIDKNVFDSLKVLDNKNCLVIESHYNSKDSYFLPQNIYYRFFYKQEFFDFNDVTKIIEQKYGITSINNEFLNRILNKYYSDLFFFKKIIKNFNVKQIYVVQNGIQKGIFRAAKELGIKTFEYQHGIVTENHIAYNYPKIDFLEEQVSLPNIIFSYAPIWFQNNFLPNVNILSLGNSFLYKQLQQNAKKTPIRGIVVISADDIGKRLLEFLRNEKLQKEIKNIPIYFKLHPNQFHQKHYYTEQLKNFDNIKVITDEFSVGELLENFNTLFTILSTAIYEALQSQRKVILLEDDLYNGDQKSFLEYSNFYIIKKVNDFISALNTEIVTDKNVTFFAPFDKEAFLNAL
ncbi:capsular polysaccharide export protein, LipB/KpsS family [Capnocytophaga gingivalis]|jgi:hypothetical protein|uniref:Uncharacterized protein n=1 Tax=Capnocytophaga gingivalis TaxID=1017 RepID=A0ABU5Y6P5_9FLAO|nr:hypothetical protein [Capnocytophaga gingivalis]MEB3039586.1 hypothetical protein [Capnocytophaga gingivalis]